MESVLNVSISRFKSAKSTIASSINLLNWLADDSYSATVKKIREVKTKEERDNLKRTLPAVTISGEFTERRCDALIKHSGLICIDIDAKDNMHIEDFGEMKKVLSKAPFVAYCALSVSGNGYYAIIPIKSPAKHEAHFQALQKIFAQKGITIDKACKDVARLRFYSWDDEPYVNHSAVLFEDVIEDVPRNIIRQNTFIPDWTAAVIQVEDCINEIEDSSVDITSGYKNWLNVGFALASEFGESGREYFHRVSQFHDEYDPDKTDDQYTSCLESDSGTGKYITIATFFYLCKQAGIASSNARAP